MRNASETVKRRFMPASSASMEGTCPWTEAAAFVPPAAGREAPYPAASTAAMIASGDSDWGSYSTSMEPPSRLTFTDETPGNFSTALVTWAEQAEQVMPVTVNFCFIGHLA